MPDIAAMFSPTASTYLAMNDRLEVLCLNLRIAQMPPGHPPTSAQTKSVSSRIRLCPFDARRLSHQIAITETTFTAVRIHSAITPY